MQTSDPNLNPSTTKISMMKIKRNLIQIYLLYSAMLPAMVQAKFDYMTNDNGTVTITGYTRPGGAVTIPSRINRRPVTSIGDGAFYNSRSLTNVKIPNSVTSIGSGAFSQCISLKAITVDALNSVYSSVDGVLFDKSQTKLIQCPGGKAGSYTIGTNVTSIGDDAFDGCSSLSSVTIPNSVTSIGDRAFYDCYSLTNVTIGNSVTKIGSYAFSDCYSLTNVTIGNSVTSIGDRAFSDCRSLTSVTTGNSVTSIGDKAFYDCRSLTNVTTGNSVTRIGSAAFDGCTSLSGVKVPNSVTSIGSAAFSQCTSLKAITVDALNSFYSSVGGVLFDKSQTTLIQCPKGKAGSYTIPNSVTRIGDAGLVTRIPYPEGEAGRHTIPNSIVTTGGSAFFECSSLTSVTIPNSVTNIGSYAFYSCRSLTNVTIGNSVTGIGDWVFGDCTSLTAVCFKGNAPRLGSAVFNADNHATIYYLPGTTGWGRTFGGRPTMLWKPQAQTSDASLGVRTNQFGFNINWASSLVSIRSPRMNFWSRGNLFSCGIK